MDTLQKFMFEQSQVRGELVEISDAWRQVLALRSYPRAVITMLQTRIMITVAEIQVSNLKT